MNFRLYHIIVKICIIFLTLSNTCVAFYHHHNLFTYSKLVKGSDLKLKDSNFPSMLPLWRAIKSNVPPVVSGAYFEDTGI